LTHLVSLLKLYILCNRNSNGLWIHSMCFWNTSESKI